MRAQIEKYFSRIYPFVRREKCIKIFKAVSLGLKIVFFAVLALLGLCFLGEESFTYGNYLLNQKQILSACVQCDAFGIHFSFAVAAASCLLLIFCAVHPPKGLLLCLLVWFGASFALLVSSDMLSFSLNPSAYRFPDEVIIYGVKIREDFIFVSIAWLYALQSYLRLPLRKYILSVSVPAFLVWIVWYYSSHLHPYYYY